MANSLPLEMQWQSTFQGKTSYAANCQKDVLIIVSSESLQGDDTVSRRTFELTNEDIDKLQRLNFPRPAEQWKDDASIMEARYKMDKENYGSTIVKREETKQSILKACEFLMKSTTKAGSKCVDKITFTYKYLYMYSSYSLHKHTIQLHFTTLVLERRTQETGVLRMASSRLEI